MTGSETLKVRSTWEVAVALACDFGVCRTDPIAEAVSVEVRLNPFSSSPDVCLAAAEALLEKIGLTGSGHAADDEASSAKVWKGAAVFASG